jgi:hypothetical protein
LTFANVMSAIAVFIALGGSAWALARNSVGPRQIRANAVRSSDVKNNALKGIDINESTLSLPASSVTGGSDVALPTAESGGDCDADTPEDCASATLNLSGSTQLLAVASGNWINSGSFSGTGDSNIATCRLQLNDVNTDAQVNMGEKQTVTGATPWAQGGGEGGFALSDIIGPVGPGTVQVDLNCDDFSDNVIDLSAVRLSVVALG